MIVYIIMTIIAIFCYFLSEKINNKKGKIALKIMAGVPFFLISAIRYKVGTDYIFRYVNDFNKIANGLDVENMEILFKFLIKLCLLITKNSQSIFIITAGLITFFIMMAIYKNSKNVYVSILLFVLGGFFFQSLNLVRQFLAMSIILFSYKYLFDKKKILYFVITVIIAFFIHSSSIIMLILLMLYKYYVCNPITISLIIIIISLLGDLIMKMIFPIIENTRFSVYLIGFYAKGDVSILYNIANILLYIFMVIIYIYKRNHSNNEDKDKFFINMQGMAVICTCMSSIHILFSRIAYYFMIFQIISIPHFIETLKIDKEYKKKMLYVGILMFFLIIICYTNVLHNDHEPLPYQTIFQREK